MAIINYYNRHKFKSNRALQLIFHKSATYKIPPGFYSIDICCVGGGCGGFGLYDKNGNFHYLTGGSSGFVVNNYKIQISNNAEIQVIIGNGGPFSESLNPGFLQRSGKQEIGYVNSVGNYGQPTYVVYNGNIISHAYGGQDLKPSVGDELARGIGPYTYGDIGRYSRSDIGSASVLFPIPISIPIYGYYKPMHSSYYILGNIPNLIVQGGGNLPGFTKGSPSIITGVGLDKIEIDYINKNFINNLTYSKLLGGGDGIIPIIVNYFHSIGQEGRCGLGPTRIFEDGDWIAGGGETGQDGGGIGNTSGTPNTGGGGGNASAGGSGLCIVRCYPDDNRPNVLFIRGGNEFIVE